jgi:hypothetical protein
MLTPQDALSDCIHALPTFESYWNGEDIFRYEDGSYSVCGIYMTLCWFLREHWRDLTEPDWLSLASLALDHSNRSENPGNDVGACLIEGIEGEEFSPLVLRYFDDELLRRFGFEA